MTDDGYLKNVMKEFVLEANRVWNPNNLLVSTALLSERGLAVNVSTSSKNW